MCFKITWKTHLLSFVLSLLLTLCLYDTFYFIMKEYVERVAVLVPKEFLMIFCLLSLLLMVAKVSLFHELIHGLCYKLFGGRVRYGFKLIYAYTEETSGKPIERIAFLIILLAPLTIISLLSLLLPLYLGGMIFIINLTGSTGDIIMALALIRYDFDSYIIDRKYGFDVIK